MILFNDKLRGNLGKLLDSTFRRGLMGESDQFIYNIDVYLKNDPTAMSEYYNAGLRALMNVTGKGGKPAVKDVKELKDEMFVAIFGMLTYHTFVGIDMTKEGYPAALYTRNISMIEQMYKSGYITPDTDLKKLYEGLYGNKTALGIEDSSFYVIRLDVSTFVKDKVLFKPTVPRSRVKIGVGKDFVFIPIDFMHIAADLLNTAGKQMFKFTKTSVTGRKTHIATCNPDIVRKAYADAPNNLVESKIKKVQCGYDDVKLRYVAYDLEASVYGLGIASFRPEMLDELKKANAKQLDTSLHNVNYDHLRGIFKTKVKRMRLADFDQFKFIDLSTYPTVSQKADAVMAMAEEIDTRDLYEIMKAYPNIFGDVSDALKTRERNSPKILKHLQTVDNFDIQSVKDMLNNGVVRITAKNKSNQVYERYASNNTQVLARFLGKNYVKEFESSSIRLKALKAEILDKTSDGTKLSRDELEALLVEYDVLSLVDSSAFVSKNPINVLDESIDAVYDKRSNTINDQMILYHKITATDRSNLYGQVNINNIIAIEYADFDNK